MFLKMVKRKMVAGLLALAGLVVSPVMAKADYLTFQNMVPGAYTSGWIEAGDGSNTLGENAYIGQMQFSHIVGNDPNGQGKTLDTFCVNLFNNETNQQYSVTPSQIDSHYLKPNANEMAYLYATYGQQSLSNNDVLAGGLQLAIWNLTVNPDPSVYKSVSFFDSNTGAYFSATDVDQKYLNEAQSLLDEAFTNAFSGTTSFLDQVQLLYSPMGPGQSVLAPVPEPASMAMALIGIPCVGGIARFVRRRGKPVSE